MSKPQHKLVQNERNKRQKNRLKAGGKKWTNSVIVWPTRFIIVLSAINNFVMLTFSLLLNLFHVALTLTLYLQKMSVIFGDRSYSAE